MRLKNITDVNLVKHPAKTSHVPCIYLASMILTLFAGITGCDSIEPDHLQGEYPAPRWSPDADIWVGAYFGAWNHYAPPGGNWGHVPTDEIDWDAFTHMFYFSLFANKDGTLTPVEEYQNFSPDRIKAIVSAAHEHHTPVIFSVGGWGNYEEFSRAIRPENRDSFIGNLISVMIRWGFDGIDIDMEPIESRDEEHYAEFISDLYRQMMKQITPLGYRPVLTAATSWKPGLFARLHEYFDQINLMTYDYSGAWGGWVSWHNAPLYDGGHVFESSGRPLPSADNSVMEFTEAGVPYDKLGIGIDFYGYKWTGFVTGPLQNWIFPPTVTPNIPYYQIKEDYYDENAYRWDDQANAAYLSLRGRTPLENTFISFCDENAIRSKIEYARNNNIGGVFIWEIGGGHFSDRPPGEKDPLLQTVKMEVHGR